MQLQATYDLLIGADGARSTVRDILQVPHGTFYLMSSHPSKGKGQRNRICLVWPRSAKT